MRIAFYAPMKSPTHGTPSGDRRVAGLLMEALARAGHRVELASTFRSYDAEGDAQRQAALREQGIGLGRRLAAQWRDGSGAARPDLWFTYHVYYKSPDWLGPEASAALGIPYVIAEASHAAKRAAGPWQLNHEGAAAAIRGADLLLCPSQDDIEGLSSLAAPGRITFMPPFLDPAPFRLAAAAREVHRARLAQAHGLDPSVPWIAVAAMTRPGDKLASFRLLSRALSRLRDLPWRFLIAGDGAARTEVEALFAAAVPGRAAFLGALALAEVAELYGAGDLCVWPAVNEAYGMAMLEAQAAGVPVVSSATRGVPDVIAHGTTGLLAPAAGEEETAAAIAGFVRELLGDAGRRAAMGRAAAAFVASERSLDSAQKRLEQAFTRLQAPAGAGLAAGASSN